MTVDSLGKHNSDLSQHLTENDFPFCFSVNCLISVLALFVKLGIFVCKFYYTKKIE